MKKKAVKRRAAKDESKFRPASMRFRFPDGSTEEMSVEVYEGTLARQMHDLLVHESSAYRQLGAHLAQEQAKRRIDAQVPQNNRAKANEARARKAIDEALARFNDWRADRRRKDALRRLSIQDQLRRYLKIARPKERDRRKLSKLLKAGTIK